jgi:hypothetical protein
MPVSPLDCSRANSEGDTVAHQPLDWRTVMQP